MPRRCSKAFRSVSFLFVAACAATTAQAEDAPFSPELIQLVGACPSLAKLNTVLFDRMGYTLMGHPYYKARGFEEYMYYDLDCGGTVDGNPRWILDTDKPALDRERDLDNDAVCNYDARLASTDGTKPPQLATWKMRCNGTWTDVHLALLIVTSTSTTSTSTSTTTSTSTMTTTSTSTSTTTTVSSSTTSSTTSTTTTTSTSTTTSTTNTTTSTTVSSTTTSTTTTTLSSTTTTSTTSTTTTLTWLVMSGMCEYKGFLNGLVFREAGHTANGAPWFKSLIGEQYIYYDVDCNGDALGGAPRWIIDNTAPNESYTLDLDGDGECNYHARIDSVDTSHPPNEGHWNVSCGSHWEVVDVKFGSSDPTILEAQLRPSEEPDEPESAAPDSHTTSYGPTDTANEPQYTTTSASTSTVTHPHEEPVAVKTTKKFSLHGACAEKEFLDHLVFTLQGHTASGAPYYKSDAEDQYIYYDPACGGVGQVGKPRWIIDTDAPNVTAEADLDQDGKCEYYAWTTGNAAHLPTNAAWRMWCNMEWADYALTIVDHDDGEHRMINAARPARSGCGGAIAIVGAVALIVGWF